MLDGVFDSGSQVDSLPLLPKPRMDLHLLLTP